jgi:hypothetical protein
MVLHGLPIIDASDIAPQLALNAPGSLGRTDRLRRAANRR